MENGTPSPTWSGSAAIVCRGKVPAPAALREALVRRGFVVEEIETTHGAVGRAVLAARRDAASRVVVVLVEPDSLSRPHELVRAIATISPRALCWTCKRSGARVELRAVADSDLAAWQATGKLVESSVRSAAAGGSSVITATRPSNDGAERAYEERPLGGATPSLRLTGEWQGQAEVPPSGPADLPAPVLTDEELAMLLGDDTSAAEP